MEFLPINPNEIGKEGKINSFGNNEAIKKYNKSLTSELTFKQLNPGQAERVVWNSFDEEWMFHYGEWMKFSGKVWITYLSFNDFAEHEPSGREDPVQQERQ